MQIVFFKKSNKSMFLSTILVAILLFPLMGSIPTKLTEATMIRNYAYPETHGMQQNASSSIGLLNTNINSTMYKNATETLNQANNSTIRMKSGQNNAISFRFPDGNQTMSSSDITATANVISSSNAVAQSPSKVSADFNGDGFGDKAIGVPDEDIGVVRDAGAVNVIYGSPSGLSAAALITDQLWTQNSTGIEGVAEKDDLFGWTLSSGDYNGDGKDDLAIGAPFEGIGPMRNVGAVNIIYGSANGLSASAILPAQLWTQDSTGVEDDAEGDDYFGYSLSSADYNGDGKDDLSIGVPAEDIGLLNNVGAVNVIYGSPNGLSAHALLTNTAIPSQLWSQHSNGIEGDAETDDWFGYTLSSGDYNGDGKSDVAIGVPPEDTSTAGIAAGTGAVNVIYGSIGGLSTSSVLPAQFWTQNSTGIEGVAEVDDVFGLILSSGDYNGDGKSDVAIGVPREDINGPNVGAVNVIYGSIDGLSTTAVLPAQFWTQNSTSIQGIAETEDNFGSSLSSGDYNGDGKDDLAIGVPQEDVDLTVATLENFDNTVTSGLVAADTGVVQVIYGSNLSGLSASAALPDQVLRQGFANIEDLSEDSDLFGYSS